MKHITLFFTVLLISIVSIAQVQITSVVTTDETCPGACDGTLTINTTGGTAPEMYDIGGVPQSSNIFTGLCATTYTVTVNDALPSSDITTATVASPTPLTYTLSTTNCSAYGICDGQATVTISGGTPPYLITYYDAVMSPLQSGTNASIINLCAGTYNVDVTDANGCPATGPVGPSLTQFSITEPAPPPLSGGYSIIFASCPGVCDGSATAYGSGGVPPLTFSSPGYGNACDGDLIPSVTITDAIGQQYVITGFQMSAIGPDMLSPIVIDESCPGVCDGQVDANNLDKYFPPQQYSIDGITYQSSPIFTGLCDGSHQVYMTDSKGCFTFAPFFINPSTPITFTLSSTNPSSIGACDGTNDIIISGGTPPYIITYYASNGTTVLQSGPSTLINSLCAGNYNVDVIDANGCSSGTGLTLFTITDPIVTSITSANNSELINTIYPNPTKGIINIDFSDKTEFPITINVIDINGRVIHEKIFNSKSEGKMDISEFQKGVYMLKNEKIGINSTIILE